MFLHYAQECSNGPTDLPVILIHSMTFLYQQDRRHPGVEVQLASLHRRTVQAFLVQSCLLVRCGICNDMINHISKLASISGKHALCPGSRLPFS